LSPTKKAVKKTTKTAAAEAAATESVPAANPAAKKSAAKESAAKKEPVVTQVAPRASGKRKKAVAKDDAAPEAKPRRAAARTVGSRGRSLVIVESPAKARTIAKYLGPGFEVKASNGHVRDLPKSKLGVDVAKGFLPSYVLIKGKGKILKDLKASAKNAATI